MSKDFNDFLALMDTKDWSLIPEKIHKNIKALDLSNPSHIKLLVEEITKSNLETTLTILKEYHEWCN